MLTPALVSATKKVFKKVLFNGLTVLVHPTNTPIKESPATTAISPRKVSTQIWYHVGSKDERSGMRGYAHLLEHMIFKGTATLSESDINRITHKLSGSTNAFTSYDYTGYLFDFPGHHWEMALSILSDCMRNCLFQQEHLNSEMKAVIQELKMYKDNYKSSLAEQMISTIFSDHPYHYPIIGFKQDLWQMHREGLLEFYHKHYVPNNATLVVVGDVDPEGVFAQAEKYFSAIPADPNYKRETYYHSADLMSKNVTIYRDIQQPLLMFAFVMPPASLAIDFQLDTLSWIVGIGKGSRLYRRLVDTLGIATSVSAFSYDLFDQSIMFIAVEPKNIEGREQIKEEIEAIFASIAKDGFTDNELTRAIKQTKATLLSTLEDTQQQAYLIGKGYLETGNENYLFDYLNYSTETLAADLQKLVSLYCRPSVMHEGAVLPLNDIDRTVWQELQKISDLEDARVLTQVTRESDELLATHTQEVIAKEAPAFTFPKPEKVVLGNGLTLLYATNDNVPKVDLILELKAKSFYDPEGKEGLYSFMCAMMLEGTKNYPGLAFVDELDKFGMSLSIAPGVIRMNMLKDDVKKGLILLNEVLTQASFPQEAIEKIRAQRISQLTNFWDTPTQFIGQLARENVYQQHPYHKNAWGSIESLQSITRKDLLQAYQQFMTPVGACLAIVGDCAQCDLPSLAEKSFSSWKGKEVPACSFETIEIPTTDRDVTYSINRDQVVVAFCTPSISRTDADFDKLLLYDQILTGGALGSMHSRLFHLRERSGLFYTIGGSLISNADEQPGMLYIRTIVSPDRLEEAKHSIKEVLQKHLEVSQDELNEARNALFAALVNQFESNDGTASSFLFLQRYGLPHDYFDTRRETLKAITPEQVTQAVKKVVERGLITIMAGRV